VIGLNFSIMDSRPTGLGVYAENVLKEMVVQLKEAHLWGGRPIPGIPSGWKQTVLARSPGHLSRQLLLQTQFRRISGTCDVVYSPVPELPIGMSTPGVFVLHDLIPLQFPEYHSAQLVAFFRYVVRHLAWRSARIIAISKSTRDDVVRRFGIPSDKVVVIPNGVGSLERTPEDKQRKQTRPHPHPYLLYTGRLAPYKNVALLLEAYARHWIRRELRLLICGKPERDFVQRMVARSEALGIADRVVFLGYVTKQHLSDLYDGASACVFPSLAEGFNMGAAEAIARGCPILLSDIPVHREYFSGRASFFSPHDADDLMRLFDGFPDLAVSSEMLPEILSWKHCVEATLRVLAEVGGRSAQ
jgi:glycosyltransferase involved in cell wall biosynthesis